MTKKISFRVDDDMHTFLMSLPDKQRSQYIREALQSKVAMDPVSDKIDKVLSMVENIQQALKDGSFSVPQSEEEKEREHIFDLISESMEDFL